MGIGGRAKRGPLSTPQPRPHGRVCREEGLFAEANESPVLDFQGSCPLRSEDGRLGPGWPREQRQADSPGDQRRDRGRETNIGMVVAATGEHDAREARSRSQRGSGSVCRLAARRWASTATGAVYFKEDIATAVNKYLLQTALEEVAHYVTGATDMSRDFQNFLTTWIVEVLWDGQRSSHA